MNSRAHFLRAVHRRILGPKQKLAYIPVNDCAQISLAYFTGPVAWAARDKSPLRYNGRARSNSNTSAGFARLCTGLVALDAAATRTYPESQVSTEDPWFLGASATTIRTESDGTEEVRMKVDCDRVSRQLVLPTSGARVLQEAANGSSQSRIAANDDTPFSACPPARMILLSVGCTAIAKTESPRVGKKFDAMSVLASKTPFALRRPP